MHSERSLALHCIEQHACTTNDRIEQDAQRSSEMQTQRSARMHRVRCMTMQQSACIKIECTNARYLPIERSRRCNEHNASEDNKSLILNKQPRRSQRRDPPSQASSRSNQTPRFMHTYESLWCCTICTITPRRPLSSQSHSRSRSVHSNVPSE